MAVKVDIRRHPGRLSVIARSKSADFGVGEIYVNGAFNRQKAGWLAGKGHDPIELPDIIKSTTRNMIRLGVVTFDEGKARKAIRDAVYFAALWLRNRIQTGGLWMNLTTTALEKVWLCAHGLATTAYGVPPPYGIRTGKMVVNILSRWRGSKGGGRKA